MQQVTLIFFLVHENYFLEICSNHRKLMHFKSGISAVFTQASGFSQASDHRHSCLLPLKSRHICNIRLKMDNVASDSRDAVACGRMLGGGLWITPESGAVSLPWQGALQINV